MNARTCARTFPPSRSAWLLLGLFACACLPGERTATQLLVSVYADADVAQQLKLVRAFLYRADATDEDDPTEELPFPVLADELGDGTIPMLFSFGITRGREERFKLVIKGYDSSDSGAQPVIEQKALASFQTHQKVVIDMLLGSACYDRAADCSGLELTCVPLRSPDVSAGDCAPVPEAIARPELGALGAVVQRSEPVAMSNPADDAGDVRGDAGTDSGRLPADPIDAGQPEVDDGAVTVLPPSWPPAGCDAVYELRAHAAGDAQSPLSIAAGAIRTQTVTLDAPWGSEPVQAIGFRPLIDNRAVLRDFNLAAAAGSTLMLWAPGDTQFTPYPADVGVDLPTGPQSLRLSLVYDTSASSAAELDRSGVAVCVVRGANLRANRAAIFTGLTVISGPLAPANTLGHAVTASCRVAASQTVHLLASEPYAHRFATHMRFVVNKANGTSQVLLDAPFSWGSQSSVVHVPEVLLDTGDTVTTTCTYDNPTSSNVNFGENPATNEMCFNFATYYPAGALSCASAGF